MRTIRWRRWAAASTISGIQVEGIDEVAERLEKAGVVFTKKPGDGVLGSKTAFIIAPDNVVIELVEEP